MKLPVYWGCMIQTTEYAYEMSVRRVLNELGVELVDLKETSCCGAPMRHINGAAAIYLASRNLAIVERDGFQNLLVPCNGCHLSFRETMHYLNSNEERKGKNARILQNEDLEYNKGDLRIYHVIDFLYDFIGIDKLKKKVVKSLAGLTLASHTGCHIIRPSDVGGLADDSEKPQKLDKLIQTLGAKTVDYPEKLDCCGSGLLLSHGETTLTLAGLKTRTLQEREVGGLIDSCPACHMMFDARQEACGATIGKNISLPVLYYSQLLGIAMGIEEEKLGLHLNQSPIEKLLEKIG